MTSLVVSLHDVAPSTSDATRRWVRLLADRGIPLTHLVVPGPWEGVPLRLDPALAAWLGTRLERGDEICQHGWTHRAVRAGVPRVRRAVASAAARGCAEFAALDEREARRRLEAGRHVLAELGLRPEGFVAPGWLTSRGTRAALRALGFRYYTTHLAVHDVTARRRLLAPVLSHRAGAPTAPVGAAVVRHGAARLVAAGIDVRIALHPADLASPTLVAASLGAIDTVLDAGATPRTYSGALGLARAAQVEVAA